MRDRNYRAETTYRHRAIEIVIDQPSDVSYHPYVSYMDKAVAFRELIELTSPHIGEARVRELVDYFMAATNPVEPMLYKNRPAGEDLVTFMRREYRDRGLIPELSSRKLALRDRALDAAYRRLLGEGRIPEDIKLPKEVQRTNKSERGELKAE
jgi:hypothetical protein